MTAPALRFLLVALGFAFARPARGTEAVTALTVVGGGGCPLAGDVQREVERLGANMHAAGQHVIVLVEPDQMILRFRSADGRDGDRAFPLPDTCAQRASVAAVAMASWLGQGAGPEAVLADPPGASTPIPTGQPAPAPAPSPRIEDVDGLGDVEPPASNPDARAAWKLGVGVVGTSADGWRPGMRLELARMIPLGAVSFGWAAAAVVAWPHQQIVGAGESHWMRSSAFLGPRIGIKSGALHFVYDLAAVVSVFRAWGQGYQKNRDDLGAVLGASTGVRAVWAGAPSWWLDARAVATGPTRLRGGSVGGSGADEPSKKLSQLDFHLGAGVTFDLF